MIVELKIKDGMSEKAINILLKDLFFDKIDIKDKEYIQKQQELNNILNNAKLYPEKLKSHNEVWEIIEEKIKKWLSLFVIFNVTTLQTFIKKLNMVKYTIQTGGGVLYV